MITEQKQETEETCLVLAPCSECGETENICCGDEEESQCTKHCTNNHSFNPQITYYPEG